MIEFEKIREEVKKTSPLIHCITNPISINQSANAILAVGARPMMAEHPEEVREITKTSSALVLNLGNITDVRMKSMLLSADAAYENDIPVVLDLVGVACSALRRRFAFELLKKGSPGIVKGNYSEINAMYDSVYTASGVDADLKLGMEQTVLVAEQLAKKHSTTVLASGAIDIVTNGKRTVIVKNGTPQLAAITGSGCMLGMLAGAYISSADAFDAAVLSCVVLGIAGELSETDKGNGTFLVNLIDSLSTLSGIERYVNLEEI